MSEISKIGGVQNASDAHKEAEDGVADDVAGAAGAASMMLELASVKSQIQNVLSQYGIENVDEVMDMIKASPEVLQLLKSAGSPEEAIQKLQEALSDNNLSQKLTDGAMV